MEGTRKKALDQSSRERKERMQWYEALVAIKIRDKKQNNAVVDRAPTNNLTASVFW